MRYKKLTGIILKKQNYKEADQILTVWTKEAGKIRILAKSIRKPQSKMNYAVQDLGLCELDVTGQNLVVLIGAKPLGRFQNLQKDLKKTVIGFYAAELMLKMTADEHPNVEAFNLLSDFLHNLDRLDYSVRYYPLLECFSLKLMDNLGFAIPSTADSDLEMLSQLEFEDFDKLQLADDRIEELHSTINKFIEYILERNIKSEILLNQLT